MKFHCVDQALFRQTHKNLSQRKGGGIQKESGEITPQGFMAQKAT